MRPRFPILNTQIDVENMDFGDYTVDLQKAEIRVTVYDLIVIDTHPQSAEVGDSNIHILIFSGVSRSVRNIAKYSNGDPTIASFEPNQIFIDEMPIPTTPESKYGVLYGVVRSISAWMHWEIEAHSYRIELPPQN